MTGEDQNMDKIFRDKLGDFEQAPPAYVWDRLQERMAPERKSNKTLYIRIAGIAASLLIVLGIGWMVSTQKPDGNTPVATNEAINAAPQAVQKAPLTSTDVISQTETKPTVAMAVATSNAPANSRTTVKSQTHQRNQNQAKTTIAIQPDKASDNLSEILMRPVKSLSNSLKAAEKQQLKAIPSEEEHHLSPEEMRIIEANKAMLAMNKAEENKNAWLVGAAVSPNYTINQTSHSKQYSARMTKAQSTNNVNLGGGLSVQCKTGKRWSVQSGVYYNKLSQTSTNASDGRSLAYAGNALNMMNTELAKTSNGFIMNSLAGVITMSKLPDGEMLSDPMPENALGNMVNSDNSVLLSKADFDQNFDYLEVPLMVKYQVVDSRINLSLLSGISTNVLVGNNVYMNTSSNRTRIGSTDDMSMFSYSGIFGAELNFSLAERLSLSVEPRWKYYLNSLSTNKDITYKPFSFGLFTGISYEF